jgi:DNA-binding GntR family transcriptional regulator
VVLGEKDRRIHQPSIVQLAADAVREMVLSGELRPGDRLVEERLTEELGISRPPMREALRLLGQEGLLVSIPRRGVIVTPVSPQDLYEVLTLRAVYERMAVDLGMPARDPRLIERVQRGLDGMATAAGNDDRAQFVRSAFEFHVSIVGLAHHRRLEEAYRALWLQLHLFMAVNTRLREQRHESLKENVERHRRLVTLIEAGDRRAVLAELEEHGDRSFLDEVAKELEAVPVLKPEAVEGRRTASPN